jgi:hypothetical protein
VLCWALFNSAAAGNCAEVERLFPHYAPGGVPTPTEQCIRVWANDEQWARRSAEYWRDHKQAGMVELQRLTVGSLFVAQKRMHEMLTGADTRDINERLLTSKQYELVHRTAERLPALATITPPAEVKDTSEMTREEEEAGARAAMIQRKTAR